MQKKIALLVLPAMLVLSGCGVKPAANDKIFLEDTCAHEELFNGGASAIEFNLRKQAVNENNDEVSAQPVGGAAKSVSAPSIGYQIQYDQTNDKLAIRFVAAIKETNVKAYWRRGIAAPDGSIPQSKKFSDDAQEADKYYLALSDGQTPIEIGQGDYENYAGFVVYTLRNIPYTANKGSYVAAYLNLVDQDDANIHNNSQGLAVKIEKETNYKSANAFAFDPTVSGHFLEGTINGTLFDGGANGLYRESGGTPSGNYAWYEHVALKASDSFGSFYYGHDEIFQYFGYTKYFATNSGSAYFNESSLSGYASPKGAGKYDIFVSSGKDTENYVYADKFYYVSFYADTTTYDSWETPGTNYFVHAYNGDTIYTGTWATAKMSLVSGQEHLYTYELEMKDPSTISNVIFGFYQGDALKESVAMSCSISAGGAYNINYDGGEWPGGKIPTSLSVRS